MIYYLMLIAAVIMLAGNFAFTKLYQKTEGESVESGLKFNIILGIFTFVIFFVINGFKIEANTYAVVMASLQAILVAAYSMVGFKIMSFGDMAYYTLFLMTGGMTIPYVWGLMFLDEEFSILRTVGLLVIILSMVITNLDKNKPTFKQILLCIVVFVLNGFTSVVSKEHQISTLAVSSSAFVLLTGVAKAVISVPIYIAVKCKKKNVIKTESGKPKTSLLKTAGIVFGAALISGVSYLLQLIGARELPATVVYPIITGGCIIFTAIAGWLFFKEKPTRPLIIGIVMCFIGTCMFL